MIDNLSQRDRVALAIGAVAVFLALAFFGVIQPYRGAMQRLETRISSRQQQLEQVRTLQTRYLQLQTQLSAAERRLGQGGNQSLVSQVEDMVHRYAAKDNLTAMRPQPATAQGNLREETVEVHLERMRLDQVVKLLYAIENAPAALKVRDLQIKTRFDDHSQVDAVLTVAAYRRST